MHTHSKWLLSIALVYKCDRNSIHIYIIHNNNNNIEKQSYLLIIDNTFVQQWI